MHFLITFYGIDMVYIFYLFNIIINIINSFLMYIAVLLDLGNFYKIYLINFYFMFILN